MYGGSRRPPPTFFQGQFGPLWQNYRPQLVASTGFPPSHRNFPPQLNNIYSLGNPGISLAGSFGNPCILRPGFQPGVQPRAWHAAGTSQNFRPSGGAEHKARETHKNSPGVEAYYKHSMVENPWKDLEEKYKEKNQKS